MDKDGGGRGLSQCGQGRKELIFRDFVRTSYMDVPYGFLCLWTKLLSITRCNSYRFPAFTLYLQLNLLLAKPRR